MNIGMSIGMIGMSIGMIGMSIGMIGMSIGMIGMSIGMSVELEHRFEHLHETGAHESQFSSFRSMHEHLKNRLQMWLYPSCALQLSHWKY